jgi:hypothetical protein
MFLVIGYVVIGHLSCSHLSCGHLSLDLYEGFDLAPAGQHICRKNKTITPVKSPSGAEYVAPLGLLTGAAIPISTNSAPRWGYF